MSSNTSSGGGIGVVGGLFLIFLTLKLIGIEPVGSWSWWWVTAPIWGSVALGLVVLVVAGVAMAFLPKTGGRRR